MAFYCTLQGARRQLETDNTGDDPVLFSYFESAAQAVDDFTGRFFDERIETHSFSARRGSSPEIGLEDWPLISVDQLTNGDGSIISASNYALLPYGNYPKEIIRLTAGNYWVDPSDARVACLPVDPLLSPQYADGAVLVTGKWGYHRNYTRAWKKLALTLGANINDAVDQITLSAEAGLKLDVGNVIRIGTEYMAIIGPIVESTDQGFTTAMPEVERAWNNSTPAAHTLGDDIYVWRPEPIIQLATEMAIAAFYKGRSNATGDRLVTEGIGAISIPVDLPAKIKGMLSMYKSEWRGRL